VAPKGHSQDGALSAALQVAPKEHYHGEALSAVA